MEVYTFGQHVGSDDDVIVVAPLFFVFCIEIGTYRFTQTVSVSGTYREDIVTVQTLFQVFLQIVDGIHTFAEHNQLAFQILFLVEKLVLQHIDEEIQLGVGFDCLPTLA